MRIFRPAAALLLAVSSSLASAQYFLIPSTSPATQSPASPDGPVNLISFPLPGTDITVRYPAEFHQENYRDYPNRNYRAIFGNPEGDMSCYPVLLALGGGDPLVHIRDSGEVHYTPDPPTGGVAVQELEIKCVRPTPTKPEQFVNMASSMLGAPNDTPGYHPIAGKARYNLDKKTSVILVTAHAWSKDADGVRRKSAGETFLIRFAVVREKRVFLFTTVSNDASVLNKILSLRLKLADGPTVPLAPFTIQPDDGKGNQNAFPCDPQDVCSTPASEPVR